MVMGNGSKYLLALFMALDCTDWHIRLNGWSTLMGAESQVRPSMMPRIDRIDDF
jgi:hypothetical protein